MSNNKQYKILHIPSGHYLYNFLGDGTYPYLYVKQELSNEDSSRCIVGIINDDHYVYRAIIHKSSLDLKKYFNGFVDSYTEFEIEEI